MTPRLKHLIPSGVVAGLPIATGLRQALARAEAAVAEGNRTEAVRLLDALATGFPESTAIASLRQRLAGDEATDSARVPTGEDAAVPRSPVAESPSTPGATDTPAPEPRTAITVLPEPEAPVVTESAPEAPATATPIGVETAARSAPDSVSPAPLPMPVGAEAGTGTDPTEAGTAMAAALHPPRLVGRVAPEYPAIARQRRIEGWVELEYVVDTGGRVVDVRVLDSHPTRVFDAAAERALRRWRFEPASRGGVPEPAVGRTRIDFTLG